MITDSATTRCCSTSLALLNSSYASLPDSSCLMPAVRKCTTESGRFILSEVLHDRHWPKLHCPACGPGISEFAGFARDVAGSRTTDGLRHRYWRCRSAQSSASTTSDRPPTHCKKLSCRDYLELARVAVPRAAWISAIREAERLARADELPWLQNQLSIVEAQSEVEYKNYSIGPTPTSRPISRRKFN